MNWTQVEGDWKQIKGQLKAKWAKLTDDDVRALSGKKDEVVGIIQKRYGILKEDAEQQLDEWIGKLKARLDHGDSSHAGRR